MTPTEQDYKLRTSRGALKAASAALTHLIELHTMDKTAAGEKYCQLCFCHWPCESHRTAQKALVTVTKGLS